LTDHAGELKGSSSCENDHNRLNSNEFDEDIIRNVSEMDTENNNFDEQIQQVIEIPTTNSNSEVDETMHDDHFDGQRNTDNNESEISDNESVDSFNNNSSFDDSDNDIENDAYFEKIMFTASKLTLRDIILMCIAFSLRFHLPDEALLVLVSMFNFVPALNLKILVHLCTRCQNAFFRKVNWLLTIVIVNV